MIQPSEYDPKQLKIVALTPRQIEYIKRLVQADLHSREKDFRHAVAYGVDYDDPGMDIAAYALSSLDDPRDKSKDSERLLAAAANILQLKRKDGNSYYVATALIDELDAAFDAHDAI